MAQDVLSLGGRSYTAAEDTTFEQDTFIMQHVYATRVHDVITAGGDVYLAVLESGRLLDILAGMLVPVGVPWTPTVAAETRAFIARLTDPDGKAQLQAVVRSLVVGFFVGEGNASPPSPSASSPTTTPTTSTTSTPSTSASAPPAAPPEPSAPPSGRRRRRPAGARGTASSAP